jgi:hypothetical protein
MSFKPTFIVNSVSYDQLILKSPKIKTRPLVPVTTTWKTYHEMFGYPKKTKKTKKTKLKK